MVLIKILVAGGTGFIGRELIRELLTDGHSIVVLTRDKESALRTLGENAEAVQWDDSLLLLPTNELENVEAVINLSGESIAGGRWSNDRKENILSSRINTTRAIVDAISNQVIKPKVFINASAIGFYGPHGDEELTEDDSPGNDFLAEVSKAWEEEVKKAEAFGVRTAVIRIGLVLGQGGALKQMLLPYKFYLGGSIGNGKQWVSWIHIKDLAGIFKYVLNNESLTGPVNGTAPNPVKMKDLSKSIGRVMKRPSWFTVPSFAIRLVLGEMADMLLNGQKVLPEKVSDSGYRFRFARIEGALKDILH